MNNLIRHIGLVVADLHKSKNFWTQIMGFVVVKEMHETGPQIDAMMGLKQVRLVTCKLADAAGNMLELLYFKSHDSGTLWLGQPYTLGFTHMALTVSQLDDLIKKMRNSGVSFPAEPQLSSDGSVRVIYAKCDDGVLLELVEPQ